MDPAVLRDDTLWRPWETERARTPPLLFTIPQVPPKKPLKKKEEIRPRTAAKATKTVIRERWVTAVADPNPRVRAGAGAKQLRPDPITEPHASSYYHLSEIGVKRKILTDICVRTRAAALRPDLIPKPTTGSVAAVEKSNATLNRAPEPVKISIVKSCANEYVVTRPPAVLVKNVSRGPMRRNPMYEQKRAA